jgi:hypothetical protein
MKKVSLMVLAFFIFTATPARADLRAIRNAAAVAAEWMRPAVELKIKLLIIDVVVALAVKPVYDLAVQYVVKPAYNKIEEGVKYACENYDERTIISAVGGTIGFIAITVEAFL